MASHDRRDRQAIAYHRANLLSLAQKIRWFEGVSGELSTLASEERAKADAVGSDGALHSIHIGVDTATWQLIRTCFWYRPPEAIHGVDVYDLEYLAFPDKECIRT